VQVALAKTRGDLPRAIELLTIFLDHYMNDKEAWEELVELYLQARAAAGWRSHHAGGVRFVGARARRGAPSAQLPALSPTCAANA
jgi:hypothetical protein